MDFELAKYGFKKTVKRLFEDESSFWYDHFEELQSYYKELKKIYEEVQNKIALDPRFDTTRKRSE